LRIALTGGIACGKSLVAKYLNESGVETIDADDVVHELLPDPAERKRIAAEVFADSEKRKALESKLHPQVKERINAFLKEEEGQRSKVKGLEEGQRSKVKGQTEEFNHHCLTSDLGPLTSSLRIAIIPLLFETHWDAEYDIIVCVASDSETQIQRMMTTRGYTCEEAEARLAAQMPVEEKAAKSHYVIENNGSAEELKLKVARFVDWLKENRRGEEIR